MNLLRFIEYLKDEDKALQFMKETYPEIDYYDAEIYLKDSLSADSDLVIFDSEKIEGLIEMRKDNNTYYYLFSLDLLAEVYADYSRITETDHEIVEKIINYRISDA